jgi:hypothetical protein
LPNEVARVLPGNVVSQEIWLGTDEPWPHPAHYRPFVGGPGFQFHGTVSRRSISPRCRSRFVQTTLWQLRSRWRPRHSGLCLLGLRREAVAGVYRRPYAWRVVADRREGRRRAQHPDPCRREGAPRPIRPLEGEAGGGAARAGGSALGEAEEQPALDERGLQPRPEVDRGGPLKGPVPALAMLHTVATVVVVAHVRLTVQLESQKLSDTPFASTAATFSSRPVEGGAGTIRAGKLDGLGGCTVNRNSSRIMAKSRS